MRIVTTSVMSDPLIVLMNVRRAGMTSLVAIIAMRAGLVSLPGIAALVPLVAGLSLIVAIRISAWISAAQIMTAGILVPTGAAPLLALRRSRSMGRNVPLPTTLFASVL